MTSPESSSDSSSIAIVGLAGRFPGARDVAEFWRNVREGRETISFFSDQELEVAAVSPDLRASPDYVKARGALDGVELFDAELFDLTPRLAAVMDPQQRLFMECAWEALEDAGYGAAARRGSVSLFAGVGLNTYFLNNLVAAADQLAALDELQVTILNDKDFLATHTAYKLDLKGPCLTVQTACSTSLVAVHLACQSLLNGECDLALAGGVSVKLPVKSGYVYREGGILSPDGHCRAFDAEARGTVPGSGVAVVVLKRLDEARAAGDHVRAVIRSSALNNDGALKAGFTAPSQAGQARVIAEAVALAEVDPASITYVEAHGTGTAVGDPIEVAALTEAFRAWTDEKGFCAIGSVKSNIGHLDTAAGLAGLVKTTLALEHQQIPPSLHFARPNPRIDFDASPFYVNTRLRDWPANGTPRRAGVSSFGIGGTNSHVVLEEAPAAEPGSPSRNHQLLLLSARTPAALEDATSRLATFLEAHPEVDLANVAHTLQVGREAFEHRRLLICRDAGDAIAALGTADSQRLISRRQPAVKRPLAFLFPGQGAQHVDMGRTLYEQEPTFRDAVDRCAEILRRRLDLALTEILYPAPEQAEAAAQRLDRTDTAQPALFAVEYALTRQWRQWGLEPQAMLGHSLGEYVAACLAGVFDLEDALTLVGLRGRLMQSCPEGAMLAVSLAEDRLRPWLGRELALAAVNGPERCVVSGTAAALEELERRLAQEKVAFRRLRASHAFHSPMMDPVLEPFAAELRRVELRPPRIPFLSNVTGTWIRDDEATDPEYWLRHLRHTVRFAGGVDELLRDPQRVLLEVGPGRDLTALAAPRRSHGGEQMAIASLAASRDGGAAAMLEALGRLWLAGLEPDWSGFYAHERRRRVPLPTYPFQRRRCWIDAPGAAARPRPPVEDRVADRLPASAPRRAPVRTRLLALAGELTGLDAADVDTRATFLELGVDSLLLIQFSQEIEKRFGVKLSLAQLLEEVATLDAVAARLERELPPEPPEPDRPAAAEPGPAGEDAWAVLGKTLGEQLDVMTRQLELLRAAGKESNLPARLEAAFAPRAAASEPRVHPFLARPPAGETRERLEPRQRRHLEALIERHNRRTTESKKRTQAFRPVLADNRTSVGFRLPWKEMVYPIVGERSAGARLWDVDGNDYLDVAMGFGVHFFGHNPPFVRRALEAQLAKGLQLGPQSELAGEVAELIRELTGVERAIFANSGTEAVMTAVRLARAVTGRRKIALFAGSYHGSFDGTLARGVGRHGGPALPLAAGTTAGAVADVLVLDYGEPSTLETLRAAAPELAAVLVEPVQSRRPGLQPKAFLHQLRQITRAAGTALVFDEVITGFRIHPGGAQAWFGIAADLVTYGKVVGGGLPIGVVAGKAAFMDAIDGGSWSFGDDSRPSVDKTFFAGTFCKHPLTMAAARAVLLRMKEEGPPLHDRLNRRTAALARRLNAYFEAQRVPMRVDHFGSLFFFDFHRDREYADLFFYHLLEKGVFTWEGHTCFLSTAHSDADVDFLVATVQRSVAEMREGGFLLAGEAAAAIDFPLTDSQLELWSLAQLGEKVSTSFNETLLFRFRGKLHVAELECALRQLVERHEALRTTFSRHGDHQRVHPAMPLVLPVADVSALPGERREELLEEWTSRANQTPFSLTEGPLLRAWLARVNGEEHRLALTLHHLVTDGWSTLVILRELTELYRAASTGSAARLEPATPFREYAAQRCGAARSQAVAAAEAYWLEELGGGVAPFELPIDRPRPPVKTFNGARLARTLDAVAASDVHRLSAANHSTVFASLLALYQLLLHYLTDQDDLVVGIAMAEQPLFDHKSLVGYCLNLVPLRSAVSWQERGFPDHLESTRKRLVAAVRHQVYPLHRLVKKLDLKRDPSRCPLVAASFHYERAQARTWPGELEVEVMAHPNGSARLDLSWTLFERQDRLVLDGICNRDLFTATTHRRWIFLFEQLLEAVVRDPRSSLESLHALLAAADGDHRSSARAARRRGHLESLKARQRTPRPEAPPRLTAR